jgi:hypothetical protein
MDKLQDLLLKADQFAARAASAKARTERNTYLSLEQSCRALAAKVRAREFEPADAMD